MVDAHTTCRSCGASRLRNVFSFGRLPLADRLLTKEMLVGDEPTYPLTVVFCPHCSLVQIAETVSPDDLFCDNYPYYSSFSDALLRHSRANAEKLISMRGLGPDSLVVELASNDGYMLRNFKEQGIQVLGIDPADGPAKVAQEAGIETLCKFFTRTLASELRASSRGADVIIANNVLAHVPDLNGFVQGIAILLNKTGRAVIEVPYVRDLIDHCEFDTIYHEHLCYYSVTSLTALFERHDLYLNDVERLSIHGGSLRLHVEHTPNRSNVVSQLLAEEQSIGLDGYGYYQAFATRIENIRNTLLALLHDLKHQGHRIAAYGAAAKGATLINYVGIGDDLIDFVVDRNVHKQGCYMPGRHLPILPCNTLLEIMPDEVLLLAWNFADEIIEQQKEYLDRGGHFIIPVPEPRLVDMAGVIQK